MSVFKNMINSVYKFDGYSDYIKYKLPYVFLYILVITFIFSAVSSRSLLKKYFWEYGGSDGIIEKLVPEFSISKKDGLQIEKVIAKSFLDSDGLFSYFDYIIDTDEDSPQFTKDWFKEKYNYSPAYGIEPPLLYVTAKKTYLMYPQALKETEDMSGIAAFSNYNLFTELGLSSKSDFFSFAWVVDFLFGLMLLSVFFTTLVYFLIMILYYSVAVLLFFRLIRNKKPKFSDIFKISSFTIAPIAFFQILIDFLSFVSVRLFGFAIFIPPFAPAALFIVYSIVIYKKNKIPMTEIK